MNKVFSSHHVLADLMIDLQVAMEECLVWDCELPTPEALQSSEPFCIDTMTFEQWLRFVMIERFNVLLESGTKLPARCDIAPMAEEALKGKPQKGVQRVVECLTKIDQYLSATA
ncbi:YqcC family protein [Marinomonas sp.]|nr:YqcC family protein [Marinomonas sp.]MDB4837375.1 YqcC family protein [Marinomonas sp.]